jgi:putative GTP pyrophosphokinase
MKEDKIISEYKEAILHFSNLNDKCLSLLNELCGQKPIQIHSISSRVKTEESLKGKIANKGEKYNSLSDITDILGIRIITLFEDDVPKVENVIKDEFEVDADNSEDKFQRLKANEFGYRSVHFVCSIGKNRKHLPEYKNISLFKFEIQVRSILQHAWADIEHDLGYKYEDDLPAYIQRDFFRIAGLLELADMEFLRIKKEIKLYSDELKINDKSINIPINLISFDKFLEESFVLNRIESKIAEVNNVPIQGKFRVSQMMKIFTLLDLVNLTELEEILEHKEKQLIDFSSKWIEGQNLLRKGLSVWTLAYMLKAEAGKDDLEDYLKSMNIGETQYLTTNSERIYRTLDQTKYP